MSSDKPRRHTDIERLRIGFDILAPYDDTDGSVDVGRDLVIYAGPCGYPPDKYTIEDQAALTAARWFYDEDMERWGYA